MKKEENLIVSTIISLKHIQKDNSSLASIFITGSFMFYLIFLLSIYNSPL